MAYAAAVWGDRVAVESVRGVPYRMYADRPRRIESLLAFADRWGERPHIVQGGRTITFIALRDASAEKARVLAQRGIARGDRVMLLGWNSPEWIVNFWACMRLGAVPVLANAWWSEGEVGDALELLRPALTLADDHSAGKLPGAARQVPWEMPVPSPSSAASDAIGCAVDGGTSEEDPAIVIFTSGTGGRPKAAVLPHRAMLAGLQMLLHVTRRLPQQIEDSAHDIALQTGPLFHIGGAAMVLRSLTTGTTLVMPRGKFDPGEAADLIERHQVDRWAAVPTMISRVLDLPDLSSRDMRSLRAVTLGGAPVHAELLERIRRGLPSVHARIPTGYGLTENGGQATAASGKDTAEHPGSCGRALPIVEVRILQLPGLPDGEILVRAPTQMLGYYGMEASPIDVEGWLHTGDLGCIDEAGHLWVTGRSKDLIIRGGENISPAAVERNLMAIAGISEAAVFGVPNADLGEEVMAVVVTDRAYTPDDLRQALRGSLASFAVPSLWRVQREPLPINNTGKVDKPSLKQETLAELARRSLK